MSRAALHPTVVQDPADVQFVSRSLATMVDARRLAAPAGTAAAPADDADIYVTIDSVSKDGNFDAYIHVGVVGGDQDIPLMVDSGNSSLILPSLDVITEIPGYDKIYDVGTDTVTEPWGAPAKLVTGPIVLPCEGGGSYTIARCQFYACIGLNDQGKPTANFGIGCVVPWSIGDKNGLQSPLSYDPDYTCVQVDYAPVDQVFSASNMPHVAPGSRLILSQNQPEYPALFDILPDTIWMSLRPKSLSIGNSPTEWPGTREATSIAMVDTGGGPVFLSDPQNYLGRLNFPGVTLVDLPEPNWPDTCAGITDDLAFSLSDGHQTMSFSLPTAALPQSVQGLSLVVCQNNPYMRGADGMNIGGLTALFYSILIDYANAKVGFKAKNPDA